MASEVTPGGKTSVQTAVITGTDARALFEALTPGVETIESDATVRKLVSDDGSVKVVASRGSRDFAVTSPATKTEVRSRYVVVVTFEMARWIERSLDSSGRKIDVAATPKESTGEIVARVPDPIHGYHFDAPTDVALKTDQALLVTHVCTKWDNKCTTKAGNDVTIRFAKDRRIPIIYLQDSLDRAAYFSSGVDPSYIVNSRGGEFSFAVAANKVIATGGYSSYCQRQSMIDLVQAWNAKNRDLEVCTITSAVYEDVRSRFLPGNVSSAAQSTLESALGTSTVPLSLILDLFDDNDARMNYFTTRIADYLSGGALANFRVILTYRGKTRVLRDGGGPTIRWHYVHPQRASAPNVSECLTRAS